MDSFHFDQDQVSSFNFFLDFFYQKYNAQKYDFLFVYELIIIFVKRAISRANTREGRGGAGVLSPPVPPPSEISRQKIFLI